MSRSAFWLTVKGTCSLLVLFIVVVIFVHAYMYAETTLRFIGGLVGMAVFVAVGFLFGRLLHYFNIITDDEL